MIMHSCGHTLEWLLLVWAVDEPRADIVRNMCDR